MSCPKVKALCDTEDLLAFADDINLWTLSWANLKKDLGYLEAALIPGQLLFNKRKSEILTARNRLLPVDHSDWLTDAEDNEPTVDLVIVEKKCSRKKKHGTDAYPILLGGAIGRKRVLKMFQEPKFKTSVEFKKFSELNI